MYDWLRSVVVAALALSAPALSNAQQPVALISGQSVSDADLAPYMQGQMRQLSAQEFEMKSKALDNVIAQRLVEAEARRQGITPDKLLDREVDSKVPEPSEGEIEAYYLGQKDRINRPLDEVRGQMAQGLKRARLQNVRLEYVRKLRIQAGVVVMLKPPRVEVASDPKRVRGKLDAPVRIVEFSDFQCPYCQQVEPVLKEILAKYSGRVSLSYRDFPLRQIHPQAQAAAEASRCAEEKGRFWEYHDLLYANQAQLAQKDLVDRARSLNLDAPAFEACLGSGKFKGSVEEDLQSGLAAGVNGTPAFFINGIFLNGSQSRASLEKVIDAELAAIEQGRSSPATAPPPSR